MVALSQREGERASEDRSNNSKVARAAPPARTGVDHIAISPWAAVVSTATRRRALKPQHSRARRRCRGRKSYAYVTLFFCALSQGWSGPSDGPPAKTP